uniref:Reverse transcriptase domain-containing protein n=1 Tax=Clytia hemisphaerica TaxID=252671 RepID=A0A7M5TPX5_9CNID
INYYNPKTNLIDTNNVANLLLNKNSMIIGDLNCKHKNWNNPQNNPGGNSLNETLQNIDLTHSEHTEYTYKNPATGAESTIDIALWDPKNIISDIKTQNEKEVGSDHTPVTFKTTIKEKLQKFKINNKIKQYHKVNWGNLNNLFSQKFQNTPSTKNEIDHTINKLEKHINTVNKLIPEITINRTNHGINKDIRKDIQEKRRLLKEYKRTRNPIIKNQVNRLIKKIQKAIKDSENRLMNKHIDQANSKNSKESWKGINKILGQDPKPTIKKIFNPITKTDTSIKDEIAEIFKNAQKEIFQGNETSDQENENDVNSWYNQQNFTTEPSNENFFTTDEISKTIKNLKNNKAPGIDTIKNTLIKYLEPSLSPILKKIFDSCYDIGYFPKRWKEGKVIMLYKNKGAKNDTKNYRPITLLNQFGKLFEKTLEIKIRKWAEENNKINKEQSGFRKKRNTNDQLYLLTQKIYEAFNRKSGIDAIFIDFEKCFDKIWKKGLLYKLHLMNIPKKDLNIINSFLHNRNIYLS